MSIDYSDSWEEATIFLSRSRAAVQWLFIFDAVFASGIFSCSMVTCVFVFEFAEKVILSWLSSGREARIDLFVVVL